MAGLLRHHHHYLRCNLQQRPLTSYDNIFRTLRKSSKANPDCVYTLCYLVLPLSSTGRILATYLIVRPEAQYQSQGGGILLGSAAGVGECASKAKNVTAIDKTWPDTPVLFQRDGIAR